MTWTAKVARRARRWLASTLAYHRRIDGPMPDAATQRLLEGQWRALAERGTSLPPLRDVGFKAYSQTDEDGILLFLFTVIGTTSRRAVELCAGDGIECNAANLLITHGWSGLLVDGNEALVQRGRRFYAESPHTGICPPTFAHAWVTRDNVNALLETHGYTGEIDLLSIDVDGMDYWIWDAIDVIEPRVVVVEYQDIAGPERAVTVPYRDDFDAYAHPTTNGMPNYCGASLGAFVKLATRRGYRLVGCNRLCYNAFFVREPLGSAALPAVPIAECFTHPRVEWGMRERWPTVAALPWDEV